MKDTPIPYTVVKKKIEESKLSNVGKASIRELKRLVDTIEAETGEQFIRMEMGIPGLDACKIGVEAEIEALKNGVASEYPDIDGIPILKKESARFIKNFLDIEINPSNIIPTVGSMQGGFASFMTLSRMYPEKDTVLFIDPGFPVHKQQCRILGVKMESFDVYNYRGEKLREKLESYLSKGNICALLYSNPNNPSWICFTHNELRIIGELAQKYKTVVIEDLAYFAMDFRKDYSRPGQPPYQPTIAKYYNRYVLLISSSKAFSYAGQRMGLMAISNYLATEKAEGLRRFYTSDIFANAMIYGTMYSLSAGTSHSAQYALAAILKACNDTEYNFIDDVKEYGEKAKIIKKYFLDNGFRLVYDKDEDEPLADGFYFTISYPGFSGEELIEEFIYYGISAISLNITGSERNEGIRVCVSKIQRNQFDTLEKRLKKFHADHPLN